MLADSEVRACMRLELAISRLQRGMDGGVGKQMLADGERPVAGSKTLGTARHVVCVGTLTGILGGCVGMPLWTVLLVTS